MPERTGFIVSLFWTTDGPVSDGAGYTGRMRVLSLSTSLPLSFLSFSLLGSHSCSFSEFL